MGFDNECIVNIQSLAGEYFCPVCRLLVYPNEALQTQCTHLYCKPCLTYVVSTTRACPYDGYLVTEADSKPLVESNKTLAETIGKISVHCLYHRSGCSWEGPLSECTVHCSGCAFGNSPVVCNRCGVQIVHRQVQEHAQTCPGVQAQAQQPTAAQDATAATAAATAAGASDQGQTGASGGVSVSQVQTSQPPTANTAGQNPNAQAVSATQAHVPAAVVPSNEQWYQQQQYQQYYQQYPGYDPYQQQYQQHYPYQQQAVQQYHQQPVQAYPSQVPGQQQTQAYGLPQQQVQTQAQLQPQVPTPVQSQPYAQHQSHPPGQLQPQLQTQLQTPLQPLAQGQVPANSVPHPQSQPYSQVQYVQPQLGQPAPHQHMQMAQYPPTHPQPQAQHYPQIQSQPHVQIQNPAHPASLAQPPSQQGQPLNPGAQLQAQLPAAHAVTGYHSYPQLQANQQTPGGVPNLVQVSAMHQQPQQLGQMQGQFTSQPSQVRPPQSHSLMPNQLPPAIPSQVQSSGAPTAQQPSIYPHGQQPGYPAQQRPGMQPPQQPVSQQYVQQQQAFSAQSQFAAPQQHQVMQAPVRAQGPAQAHLSSQQNPALPHPPQSNIMNNFVGRPVISQSAGPQAYTQATGHANTGYIRPAQPAGNQPSANQSYAAKVNTDLTVSSEQHSVQVQHPSRTAALENPGDKMDQSMRGPDHTGKDSRNAVSDQKSQDGNDNKSSPEKKQVLGMDSNFNGVGSHSPVQDSKLNSKEEATEGVTEPSSGGKVEISKLELKDANKQDNSLTFQGEGQDGNRMENSSQGAPPGSVPIMHQSQLHSQVPGSHPFPTSELGRNHMPPIHYGQPHQQRPAAGLPTSQPGAPHATGVGHHPVQLRPQGPGQIPNQPSVSLENSSGAMLGPGHNANFPRGPNNSGLPHGHYNQGNPFQAGQPRNTGSEPFGMIGKSANPIPDGSFGQRHPPSMSDVEMFSAPRPGFFDRRPSDSLGTRDERFNMLPEESLKRFAAETVQHPIVPRVLEEDLKKFPRPSYLEAGPSAKSSGPFPLSGGPDHRAPVFSEDAMPRSFEKAPPRGSGGPARLLPPFGPGGFPQPTSDLADRSKASGFLDDNIGRNDFGRPHLDFPEPMPGFGRRDMNNSTPRSPGRDFANVPSQRFGGFPRDDTIGNDAHSFGGPKPFNFPSDLLGKEMHGSRFPAPSHLRRDEFDSTGNLRLGGPPFSHQRAGDTIGQDMFPGHQRRGEHFGSRSSIVPGYGQGSDLALAGNFAPQQPFGESFGGDRPSHPRLGEPGFRSSYSSQRYAHEGGFRPGEMEQFDNSRKRKSIMCRICRIDCETVEGLDLHSQTRDHQKKAMDMVLSIKQQNSRKLKISNEHSPLEEGSKMRNSNFEGRGNMR